MMQDASSAHAPLRIRSAEWTSRRWYASTRSVIALICGSFLYLVFISRGVGVVRAVFAVHLRLGLLAVERVDLAAHEHVRKHEVL